MQSEVYNQSVCIMNAAVYMHYVEKKNMHQIAEILNISASTVSRLLKRALDENVVKFEIEPNFLECTELATIIRKKSGLREVLVVPVLSDTNSGTALTVKKMVALEGARYIQRIITDDDIIGLTWGGTMYHLIQYLNPCRKANAKVITMHGSIANCDEKLAVDTLVRRAAMAFGGKNVSICRNGLFDRPEDYELLRSTEIYRKMTTLFENINISISGVGLLYPTTTTLLASTNYLKPEEFQELLSQHAYADIMLRFIDKNGCECNTSMKQRTFSIDLETYKKIPLKIIVASGIEKGPAIQALINGKLLDVLIIDQKLAKLLAFPIS